MSYHLLYIDFIGAKELKNIRHLPKKMRVYAVVFIPGSRNNERYTTDVDKEGDRNPNWNCNMKFTTAAADANRLTLVFKLYCKRTRGDRELGEFRVPLTELFSGEQVEQFRECKVGTPSGEQLNFSYKVASTDEPQSAHWRPPVQGQNSGGTSGMKKVFAAVGAVGSMVVTNVVGVFFSEELSSVMGDSTSGDPEIRESELDSGTSGPYDNYGTSGPDDNYGTSGPDYDNGTSGPDYDNGTSGQGLNNRT